MRDYDTMIDKLIEALENTQAKVGSWQKDVLVLLLEAVLGLYFDARREEIKKFENM